MPRIDLNQEATEESVLRFITTTWHVVQDIFIQQSGEDCQNQGKTPKQVSSGTAKRNYMLEYRYLAKLVEHSPIEDPELPSLLSLEDNLLATIVVNHPTYHTTTHFAYTIVQMLKACENDTWQNKRYDLETKGLRRRSAKIPIQRKWPLNNPLKPKGRSLTTAKKHLNHSLQKEEAH